MVWAILPLKDFVKAKGRLSGVLTADERRRLFQAMVEDVLEVLAAHPAIARTVIVSDDPAARLLAKYYAVDWWPEPEGARGLNPVIDAVAERLTAQQVESMLVVHGDLPLLSAADIQQVVECHRRTQAPALTLVPDAETDGSNCLLVSPPGAIPACYGPGSFTKHISSAKARGLTVNTLQLPGVGLDIDSPQQLQRLCEHSVQEGKQTFTFLREAKIAERLKVMAVGGSEPLPQSVHQLLCRVMKGDCLPDSDCLQLADIADERLIPSLMRAAATLRDRGFHNTITYSRKVFIPLTHLCRDVCHYCTFARTPRNIESPYMSVDQVLEQVRAGVAMGCREALFTLGEKPELRYSTARKALQAMGFASTLEYVAHVAGRVFEETGVLPHINAGCMSEAEIAMLRPVSASMGIMLESAADRLCQKGMPHYGSPDKEPALRLQTIERAGAAAVPFTSGILIGIGETRRERVEALLALRSAHRRHGHLQEIIIQNFRAKANTKMAQAPEPDLNELLWTIAVARLIFGEEMSIQAPPNLSPGVLPKLVDAGLNDWGGVSPLTPDYVNPEAPWPHLQQLQRETAAAGKYLQERLTIYPRYAVDGNQWLDEKLRPRLLELIDGDGYPRIDDWSAGESDAIPFHLTELLNRGGGRVSTDIRRIVEKARCGVELSEDELLRLFRARGDDLVYVCGQADELRREINGDSVSFVVNRNINYTNICYFKCRFCAFSKGKLSENLRGRPYDLGHDEIARRCREAWSRGATEVCMQGGIHPDYDGNTYLEILCTVREATPAMHIHAFSPLEVWQGAATLGIPLETFLRQLREAGLDTLPGTAAEILDDEVRSILCPDKLTTAQWFEVMETAHRVGFKTTATMMFGHVEHYRHWARHLLRIRQLQERSGGFTEFVPLPFVAMEAPLYLKGQARRGPTFREVLLVHAVSRLALSPLIENIQASWVKLGEEGIRACLQAGVNDLGGTLMNESITRAAGADHGQEFSPERLETLIGSVGRQPRQRCTDYSEVSPERLAAGRGAVPLVEITNTPAAKFSRAGNKRLETG